MRHFKANLLVIYWCEQGHCASRIGGDMTNVRQLPKIGKFSTCLRNNVLETKTFNEVGMFQKNKLIWKSWVLRLSIIKRNYYARSIVSKRFYKWCVENFILKGKMFTLTTSLTKVYLLNQMEHWKSGRQHLIAKPSALYWGK